MMADGESNQSVQPLAQLAADLEKGYASLALPTATATKLSFAGTPFTPFVETPGAETPTAEEILESETPDPLVVSTLPFEQTPLAPQELELVTATPRPTSTPTKGVERPFALADQETVCDPNLTPGLLQFVLTDSRRDPVAGIQIIVTWDKGEDNLYTGFKPEVGNGYADFVMQANTVYSIRVVEGGSFVPNISAPTCTGDNGESYLGGLLLTFQQP
jgi:hypothetical protein